MHLLEVNSGYHYNLRPVYNQLHDYCDVICPWFSSAGATHPGDMVEGGPSYLWWPRINRKIAYGYSWAWDYPGNPAGTNPRM